MLVALLAAVLSLPVGTLTGRVLSIAGQPVPEARVVVVEAGRAVTTDARGQYQVPDLPNGRYTLSVSAIGFAPQVRRIEIADAPLTVALPADSAPRAVQIVPDSVLLVDPVADDTVLPPPPAPSGP